MIPKKIHFCWLSSDAYPPLIDHCIKSWKKHLPDYEFVIWDQSKIDIEQIPWVKQAYEKRKYAFAADFIRLYSVYSEGGIYLDSDVEVLKNFDDLLMQKSFIGLETGGDFDPAVFGAEAGCLWIGESLKYYDGRQFIKADGTLDTCPLPIIVGQIFRDNFGIPPLAGDHPEAEVKVLPAEYFSPKSTHTQKIKCTSNTYSIHHFDGAWVDKNFSYRLKQIIHRSIILCIGQKAHNRLIAKLRNDGKI